MATTVQSKLHKALELAYAGEVYLPATHRTVLGRDGVDPGKAKHWSEYGADLSRIIEGISVHADGCPSFVMSPTVCRMMEGRMVDFQKSMVDLKEAEMLGLPFPIMNVEFDYTTGANTTARALVHMSDLHSEEVQDGFKYAMLGEDANLNPRYKAAAYKQFKELLEDKSFDVLVEIGRIEKDDHGDYLIYSPNYTFVGIQRGPDGEPWVKTSARQFAYYEPSAALDEVSEVIQRRDAHVALYAFICATLIYNTQGIEKERIDCEKLNKKRRASGKPTIAQHHYLYIDRVYRSTKAEDSSSEKYDERKHPRPHWRRAHVRGVRFGKGRTEIKPMKIPARIVAWNGKGPEPDKPSTTTIVKTRRQK
jgi:hypothetical protein